jgi:hypothetical protein
MEPLRLAGREEFHIAYVQGEATVVAMIAALAGNWGSVVQQQTIQAFTERIEALEKPVGQEQHFSQYHFVSLERVTRS